MKSKLLLVMCTIMTCLLVQTSHAQTRYQDSVFASYTLDSVTYSTVYGLKMDIYQPVVPGGDTAHVRPVVVLAHEGTFYAGDRESDPTVVRLCQDLAHKGYVTVSIDYRLTVEFNLLNADSAATEVFEAVADAKAAVRYLYQDAYTSNTYKVDTNNIYIGGNSAGAVLAMHYAYIDSVQELTVNPIFPPIVDSLGGLQGKSGNPGYSSNVKGVVSLAGGLNQVAWLGYCSTPVVMAQGNADSVVPYYCYDAESGVVPLVLCGLGSLQQNITNNTPFSETLVFPGQGHVPWDANAAMFTQVDTLVTGFLYKEVTNAVPTTCLPNGIREIANNADFKLYPNPANSVLNIQSSQFITDIAILDAMGRTVAEVSDIHALSYQMNTSGLSTGIYFVRVDNGQDLPALRKVTIE